ncbi:MAG: single-stranded-DNA-specific exonuclease RecJ, partial [Candidatus Kerfeldbacteria bacterium]|nr:single-stranded-DNA-specific exonuclease RecJ [Candidatus Kerfeldbacteria bacterium]
VHYGLQVIPKTRRPGLRALLRTLNGRSVNTGTIAFQLAPRINAAGRLDHADVAFRLLVTEDPKEADALVEQLNRLNRERQQLTDRIAREARTQIGTLDPASRVVAVYQKDWPPGVVGIVAGHLAHRYYRPAIVMGRVGDEIIGSGRSIPGFNITEALHDVAHHLSRYGGHEQACGFSLKAADGVEGFRTDFAAVVARRLTDELLEPTLDIDAELDIDDLTMAFADAVTALAPYGERMPQPVFASRGLTVHEIRAVGQEGKHVQIHVRTPSGARRKFIGFGKGKLAKEFAPGDAVDIAYEVEVNEWNGSREPQLRIRDARKSE